ncbi:hypothetical protein G6F43_014157 [Rhizopus delemar]|nr:hypothetical protein G6F43_014157 [Rhizopus delemar]
MNKQANNLGTREADVKDTRQIKTKQTQVTSDFSAGKFTIAIQVQVLEPTRSRGVHWLERTASSKFSFFGGRSSVAEEETTLESVAVGNLVEADFNWAWRLAISAFNVAFSLRNVDNSFKMSS